MRLGIFETLLWKVFLNTKTTDPYPFVHFNWQNPVERYTSLGEADNIVQVESWYYPPLPLVYRTINL